jgi:hypothetical protein
MVVVGLSERSRMRACVRKTINETLTHTADMSDTPRRDNLPSLTRPTGHPKAPPGKSPRPHRMARHRTRPSVSCTRPFTPLTTPTDPRRTALLPPPPAPLQKRRLRQEHQSPHQEPQDRPRPGTRTRAHRTGTQTTRAGGAGGGHGRRRGQHDGRGGGGCPDVYALVYDSSRRLTLFSQTPRSKHPPRSCLPATTATSRDSRCVSRASHLSVIR